jgi:anti-sigma-K factor RskA
LDLKAYISTGILESYALGATTAQENAEVEAMLAQYPELVIELSQIHDSLEEYAILHEQNPPIDLKERTRQAIFGNSEETPKGKFTVVKNVYAEKEPLNWRMAASWVLLALSVGANYYLFTKWKTTENKLEVAQSQNTQLAQNETILKASYEKKLSIFTSPEFKKVNLKGTFSAPNAYASVYFNPKNNEVYLTDMDMPELPEGKEYQLWAIVGGKPVDAGLVSERDSLGKLKLSPNATAFAITVEDKGGSNSGPKGAVLVKGTV